MAVHHAQVSLEAVRDNAMQLVNSGVVVADLRGDAYGHGLVETARAALDGGMSSLIVTRETDVAELRQAGISAEVTPSPIAAGLALYGIQAGFRAALRVTAEVLGTRTIDAGEGVSYGHTWRSTRRTNLAMVALGYADGLDRSATNRGSIWLGGAARPIAGRVAMNVVMVDLGDGTAVVGETAVLFGDPAEGEPDVGGWAAAVGIAPAEATAALGSFLPRSYS